MLKSADIQRVDKTFILERIRQEEIFQFYLERPIDLDFQFRSPLRKDENPTCSMGYFGGKLLYRDWSESKALDCFDYIMRKFRFSYGQALDQIVDDFNLTEKEPNNDIPEIFAATEYQSRGKSTKKKIKVRVQAYRNPDIHYFKSFYLTRRVTEKYKCFSIEHIWLQGKPHYNYRDIDPALGYYLGDSITGAQRWKIYFYSRIGAGRFMGNTNRINGLVQLPKYGEILVITKSMKDVMVLDQMQIPAISMQSETTMPYSRIIDPLKQRFKCIYSLYDFDRAGITGAMKMRRKYEIEPLFLTNGRFGSHNFMAKDISDFIRDHGIEKTEKLLRYAANRLSLDINVQYKP